MHPITVALKMETEEQKILALLYDVVEDSDTTLDDLKSMGFSDRIVDAVKLGDLEHNSDLTRLKTVTEKDLKRVIRNFG